MVDEEVFVLEDKRSIPIVVAKVPGLSGGMVAVQTVVVEHCAVTLTDPLMVRMSPLCTGMNPLPRMVTAVEVCGEKVDGVMEVMATFLFFVA